MPPLAHAWDPHYVVTLGQLSGTTPPTLQLALSVHRYCVVIVVVIIIIIIIMFILYEVDIRNYHNK